MQQKQPFLWGRRRVRLTKYFVTVSSVVVYKHTTCFIVLHFIFYILVYVTSCLDNQMGRTPRKNVHDYRK